MLTHLVPEGSAPARVVVLGAGGFIGGWLVAALREQGVPFLALSRTDLDLAEASADRLSDLLRPDDTVIMLAALTPDRGRGIAPTMANLRMGQALCEALQRSPVAHVVYLSSDAVYPMSEGAVDEDSPAAPSDLYGGMHLMRETMLRSTVGDRLAVLRPTLVYGAGDTHNAYGPNRLLRMARQEGRMALFGAGEEERDHVWVGDLVSLVLLVLRRRSTGMLNIATGRSITYRDLAATVAALFAAPPPVESLPRQQPISHRRFETRQLRKAFPGFAFRPLADGLRDTLSRIGPA